MKILITGNMGYIGPCVVQQLRDSHPDAVLVGLDMGYFANCLTNEEILPECKVDLQYFADMRHFPTDSLIKPVNAPTKDKEITFPIRNEKLVLKNEFLLSLSVCVPA